MKIYGYCRVSSRGQLDNYSLEQQKQEILSKYDNAKIFIEQHIRGNFSFIPNTPEK